MRNSFLYLLLVMSLIVAASGAFVFLVARYGTVDGLWLRAGGIVIGFVLSWLGSKGVFWSLARLQPAGEWLLREDPRPPVVYLRSFSDDSLTVDMPPLGFISTGPVPKMPWAKFEWPLNHLESVGPVVGAAAPGKSFTIGVPRLTLSRYGWMAEVSSLVEQARLVVIAPDDTIGIQWEIERAIELCDPQKLVFFFPDPDQNRNEHELGALRASPAGKQLELPEWADRTVFVAFDENRKPFVIAPTGFTHLMRVRKAVKELRRFLGIPEDAPRVWSRAMALPRGVAITVGVLAYVAAIAGSIQFGMHRLREEKRLEEQQYQISQHQNQPHIQVLRYETMRLLTSQELCCAERVASWLALENECRRMNTDCPEYVLQIATTQRRELLARCPSAANIPVMSREDVVMVGEELCGRMLEVDSPTSAALP